VTDKEIIENLQAENERLKAPNQKWKDKADYHYEFNKLLAERDDALARAEKAEAERDEWERKWGELVETVARRTDQAGGSK